MPNVDFRQFVDRFQVIERRLRIVELQTNPQLSIATGKTLTVNENLNLSGVSGKTLTLTNSLTVQGGGDTVLSSAGNYTLTIPATGTSALLGTAQTFTSVNTFDDDIISNSAIAVGLSSPLMPLHLQIDGSGGASVAAFDFDDGSISRISELRTGSLGSSLGWDVNNFFSFGTIAAHNQAGLTSTFMRIDTDGKVGIGTTSPSELLDLNKSTSYQLRLTNLGTGGGYWNIGQTSNGFAAGGGKLLFVPDSTSSNAATVTFTNTGNVGIGEVSPTAQLQVEQNNSGGSKPVLRLRQADESEEFIRFDSLIGAGRPIDTAALGAYYGRVRVHVQGVGDKWLALYD